MTTLHLGTSGFSFDDWRGPVYPGDLPKPHWLAYYEQHLGFNALEINYTYYQMPSHRTMATLVKKATPAFRFAIKTHRSMTHDIFQRGGVIMDSPRAFLEFREGMKPLTDSGRLACVLVQFPSAFTKTAEHQHYLDAAIDRLGGLPLVVEFRHRSWVAPSTFTHLRARGVGICAVDEPALPSLMPWVPEVTSTISYVRFHGRNAASWFGTSTAERYNYSYNDQELRALAARVTALRERAAAALVFFNNCHAGAAAKNALRFRGLLAEQGWPVPSGCAPDASLFDLPTN